MTLSERGGRAAARQNVVYLRAVVRTVDGRVRVCRRERRLQFGLLQM